jgi:hypothetical protein
VAYVPALHGKVVVSAAMSNVTSIAALMPILATNAELYASGSTDLGDYEPEMAAIRRISQIGGNAAVAVITQHFYAIPYDYSCGTAHGLSTMRPQKYECIRALGRMNTDAARDALLTILRDYWQRGPRAPDGQENSDREFCHVMSYTALYLNRWAQDSNVFATVADICADARLPVVVTNNAFLCFPSGWDEVFALHLRGTIANMMLTSEWQKCIYVLGEIQKEYERFDALPEDSPEHQERAMVAQLGLLGCGLVLDQDISTNTLLAVKASMQAKKEDASTRALENLATEWVDGEECASRTQSEAYCRARRDYTDAQRKESIIGVALHRRAAREAWAKGIIDPNVVDDLRYILSDDEADTLREIKQGQ